MLLTKSAILSLLLVWVVRAQSSPDEIEGDFNGKGVVKNNGTESGKSLVIQDEIELEKIKQEQEEMNGHGEEESRIDELHEAFVKWIQDCIGDGAYPEISDKVKEFLEESGVTEAEMKAECDNPEGEGRRKRNRVKRTYMAATVTKWEKCIIPFIYDSSLPASWRNAVEQAHANYEKYTGFRFKPYTENNAALGLTHNNYLKYMKGSGCWSFVGNLMKESGGQNISPCGGMGVASHEIGHALGLHHEHHLPHTFDMLSSHFEFVADGRYGLYTRSKYYDVYNTENEEYDMPSLMSYDDWMFNKNYGPTISTNDPELNPWLDGSSDYYMFRDLMKYYNCFDQFNDTCGTIPTCVNDGYATVLDGECRCRCPPNLDPAKKCAQKLVPVSNTGPWPAGTFSIPKGKDVDCPAGMSFGQMTRWNTEWSWSGGNRYSPGYKGGWERVHDVCTQTTSSGTGTWPAGRYCLLKRGPCPDGFEEGVIETYGQTPQRENSSYGALPDGEKGQFFEYKFCCRKDASINTKISLPNSKPFMLYAGDYWGCQEVKGMQWDMEFYHSKSNTSARDLKLTGNLPYHYAWHSGMVNTYYCYYTPEKYDCGEIKTFTTETTYEFTTPNYPANYPKVTECNWLYKSPEGTTMKIEFPDFQVSTSTDTKCSSYVELKTYMPSMKGFKFCGHGYLKWHQTVKNYMALTFRSSTSNAWKGFKARITILREADKCYKGDGRDRSYAGILDYTKNFKQCLQWKDVKCPFNQFDPAVQDVDLSHNYCRNVGTGRMPWCYIGAERCVRANCDACMTGTCFNTRNDCASLIESDSEFCAKNEYGLAKSCMLACGFCSSHSPKTVAGSVTCPTPEPVTDISPVPSSGTFNAGDIVSYTCPTTNTIRTRTCTSEGTWTHLGYVCSGCPSGWTSVLGRCHKWLGWKVQQTYNDAKASCAALNSSLAILDSDEAIDVVNGLTNYAKEDTPFIWFGMSVDSNRVWTWDDGTAFNMNTDVWESGQPNNWGGDQNCIEGSTKGTWNDIACGSSTRKYQVVCTYMPSATFVCKDDLANCAQIMAGTPSMCQTKKEYAWTNCRKSCAINTCSSSVTCSVTAPSDATRSVGSDSLKQGEYVEYKCNTGFLKTGGDEQRVCLLSGQLSGDALVCTAITSTTNYEMLSDIELWRRYYQGDTNNRAAIAIQDPSKSNTAIKYAGKITAWTYYSNFVGEIAFQIWRPNSDSAKNQTYVFIGQNVVSSSAENRIATVRITDTAQQIQAKQGDVIGVFMKSGVLTFSRCESKYMPERSFWYKTASTYDSSSVFTTNTEYKFTISSYDCRLYSLRYTMDLSG